LEVAGDEHTKARPRWCTKNISPTTSGLTASAGAPPIPIKMRAATRLLKLVASPAHILEKMRSNKLPRMTGRRPNVFANGTHHRFDAPSMSILQAMKYVNCENFFGGKPKTPVDA
jgi:hypothetical protein